MPGALDAGVPDLFGAPGNFAPPGSGEGRLPPFGAGSADAGAGFGARPSGAVSILAEDPMYVPVEVRHEGHVWTRVGMRYKGNSSLAASAGRGKLPFRVDFDEYEDQFPEVDNQRFHGFDELTFASNWNDDSQLRECFATELLRDHGVPAARCAFYTVYIDVGEGLAYWGLDSMIEDPSDAMIESTSKPTAPSWSSRSAACSRKHRPVRACASCMPSSRPTSRGPTERPRATRRSAPPRPSMPPLTAPAA
jgi:hypothetical protein